MTGPRRPGPGPERRGAELADVDVLARCPLFAGLADDDLVALAGVAARRSLRAGDTLFVAGEEPEGLAVVVRGRVKVFVMSPASGREVVLTVEHPYHAVAELVAFDGGRYPASGEALEDVELVVLEQGGLERLLGERPGLARHLLRTLGRRLRRLVGLIERISFQEVVHRLAADVLASASQGVPFTLDTNAAISGRIGTVPELVSRNLSRLHQAGAISLEGRTVAAVDDRLLRDLAAGATR